MRSACIHLFFLLVFICPVEGEEITASYKNLFFEGKSLSGHPFLADLNRLRIEIHGGNAASWHLAYDQQLIGGGIVHTPEFQQAAAAPEPTYLDLEQVLQKGERHWWQHRIHRAWLQFVRDKWELKLGRQRIAWGSGRVWNPSDRFNPIKPTALEPEEKLGVDAILATRSLSQFGTATLVVAPANRRRAVSGKYALRIRDTVGETDYAFALAKIGQERLIAADVTGNWRGGAYRIEAVYARPSQAKAYVQLSTGYDYTLSNRYFPRGLYLLAEYFYNQAAGSLSKASDRLDTLSPHLLALALGYDLTPLVRFDALALMDVAKWGVYWSPKITWSVQENLDLTFFAQFPNGKEGSEFGWMHTLIAAQVNKYF